MVEHKNFKLHSNNINQWILQMIFKKNTVSVTVYFWMVNKIMLLFHLEKIMATDKVVIEAKKLELCGAGDNAVQVKILHVPPKCGSITAVQPPPTAAGDCISAPPKVIPHQPTSSTVTVPGLQTSSPSVVVITKVATPGRVSANSQPQVTKPALSQVTSMSQTATPGRTVVITVPRAAAPQTVAVAPRLPQGTSPQLPANIQIPPGELHHHLWSPLYSHHPCWQMFHLGFNLWYLVDCMLVCVCLNVCHYICSVFVHSSLKYFLILNPGRYDVDPQWQWSADAGVPAGFGTGSAGTKRYQWSSAQNTDPAGVCVCTAFILFKGTVNVLPTVDRGRRKVM